MQENILTPYPNVKTGYRLFLSYVFKTSYILTRSYNFNKLLSYFLRHIDLKKIVLTDRLVLLFIWLDLVSPFVITINEIYFFKKISSKFIQISYVSTELLKKQI